MLTPLLLPVARFALRHGLVLPDMIDAMKAALFQAAEEQLRMRGETVTSSRLSIMTGLHRKDTAQLLKGPGLERDASSLTIKVIGAWQAKKRYLSAAGKPRSLSIGNEDSDFARLVREVSGDVHPHTVLKEMERLALVSVKESSVKLLRTGYISSFADDTTASLIARDTEDLLMAAEENVLSKDSRPNHHTATEYDNIPGGYRDELQRWIVNEAGAFHKRIRDHVSKYDRDLSGKRIPDNKKGTIRFVFCSFSRTETREVEEI